VKKEFLRGSIWWADLDPTRGSEIKKKRPVVIIGNNVINEKRRTVIVIPLSSSTNAFPPITVNVECMNKNVIAIIDQVRAIDKSRLLSEIELLSLYDLNTVSMALTKVIGL